MLPGKHPFKTLEAVGDDFDVEIDLSLDDQTIRTIAIDEITGLFTLE